MHLFCIGDIHGQATRLADLLKRLEAIDPAAQFVFLGDYIDRGPGSCQAIDLLLAFRERHPDAVFLLGNHEAMLLHYAASRDAEDLRVLRAIGFQTTLDSYPQSAGLAGLDFMPEPHRLFLSGLSRIHRVDHFAFFHAPIPRAADPDLAAPAELETLLSGRNLFNLGWEDSGQTLVFGHVPLKSPLVAPGLIGIDTGAGYGRPLTAVELPDTRFHHA